MPETVYIETTIVSYLTAWPSRDVVRLSHELITRDWWAQDRGRFDLYTSDVVLREAAAGDPVAAGERLKALDGIPLLAITDLAMDLADRLAAVPAAAGGAGRGPLGGLGCPRHGFPAHVELPAPRQRPPGW